MLRYNLDAFPSRTLSRLVVTGKRGKSALYYPPKIEPKPKLACNYNFPQTSFRQKPIQLRTGEKSVHITCSEVYLRPRWCCACRDHFSFPYIGVSPPKTDPGRALASLVMKIDVGEGTRMTKSEDLLGYGVSRSGSPVLSVPNHRSITLGTIAGSERSREGVGTPAVGRGSLTPTGGVVGVSSGVGELSNIKGPLTPTLLLHGGSKVEGGTGTIKSDHFSFPQVLLYLFQVFSLNK